MEHFAATNLEVGTGQTLATLLCLSPNSIVHLTSNCMGVRTQLTGAAVTLRKISERLGTLITYASMFGEWPSESDLG